MFGADQQRTSGGEATVACHGLNDFLPPPPPPPLPATSVINVLPRLPSRFHSCLRVAHVTCVRDVCSAWRMSALFHVCVNASELVLAGTTVMTSFATPLDRLRLCLRLLAHPLLVSLPRTMTQTTVVTGQP
ncbi:unnamed protein product [Soboliphyme baturini]|uniref:Uncharacterized protein n=1 Tax=Soboliphyme baturini TaxID=241478 RepID=A0A183J0A2_9BILA|nr:unnamed protein product [Soboliphyme baturini]